MRKIVSLVMRAPDALSRWPKLSKNAIFPLRATTTTAPGSLPCSISVLNAGPRRPSRAEERPTCSGGTVGSCAQTTAAEKTRARVRKRLANRLMARLLAGRGRSDGGILRASPALSQLVQSRSVPAGAPGSALAHPGGGAPRSASAYSGTPGRKGSRRTRVCSRVAAPCTSGSVFAPLLGSGGHVGGSRTGHAYPCHSKPRETRHGDESTQLSHRGGGDGGLGRERATRNSGGQVRPRPRS